MTVLSEDQITVMTMVMDDILKHHNMSVQDIKNKYHDKYVDSLSKNGAKTSKTNEIISQISKMPYDNVWGVYESPDTNTNRKGYKTPYEKLLKKLEKWK